jgi:hypothetical protein
VGLRSAGLDVVDEVLGRTSRRDPVSSRTGGPAGNARLTACTGVVLLILLGPATSRSVVIVGVQESG